MVSSPTSDPFPFYVRRSVTRSSTNERIRMRFQGKVVLVTGGGSGIGNATAIAFAQEGARVAVCDRDLPGIDQTVDAIRAIGGDAIGVEVDVSQSTDCQRMVEQTVHHYGRLDIAFNNAGVPGPMKDPICDIDEAEWNTVIAVNLTGVFLSMKYEIPAIRAAGGGAIINTSSVAGLVAGPTIAAYAASKHGIVGLTRAAALDCIEYGIRVNAICPGATRTAMLDMAFTVPGMEDRLRADHPIGRIAEPAETARTVLFLASEESSFIVGHALPVDGGNTIK